MSREEVVQVLAVATPLLILTSLAVTLTRRRGGERLRGRRAVLPLALIAAAAVCLVSRIVLEQ